MTSGIAISCTCGQVRGAATGLGRSTGLRLVCHCKSCRDYTRRMGRGEAPEGVDVVLTSQGRISFSTGTDALACGRMTAKGPLRWYTRCCHTPISSTLSGPGIPFSGVVTAALKPDPGRTLDDVLGPVQFRVYGKDALEGPVTPGPGEAGTARLILANGALLIKARLRGDHRRSAFFDRAGHPIATPGPLPDLAQE